MHRKTRTTLATVAAAVVTGPLLTFMAATSAVAVDGTVATQADFNGDGIGDVATSASAAYVGGKADAGQMVIVYGVKGTGPTATKRSVISQNTSGVPGSAETGDRFGYDNAYADFNGDGYDDLAVGAYGEDLGTDKDAGMLTILWGSAAGITGAGSVQIADPAGSSHDLWGRRFAAGDFDGDGKQDLAVGTDHSKVYVLKGGITKDGAYGSRQTLQAPIRTDAAPADLTAGNVNGDAATDLVVSGYEADSDQGWNANFLLLGGGSGLNASAYQKLRPGVITGIGDIDGDHFGDIVTGASWDAVEDGMTMPYAAKGGKVWITYGSASGAGAVQGITQDTAGVPGTSETDDAFGYELDLGNVNGDAYLDLVIGAAGENIGSATDTGDVVVLYGTADGITGAGAQSFHQDTAGVPGSNENYDLLGRDVKLDDVTGDGRADVVVGSGENDGNGSITFLPSDGSRITTTGSRALSPSALGVSTSGTPLLGANFAD
ncbi:VCBS repeat-containing protein [Streptomyces chilikensis]|uniref:VCBS repeat-containing protein n=1 Tax=Streptomyces chilikensis TaxID=1194079 RepID=UPI000AF254D8|nr:VCBS repeat-containing protein [Streptomyces chilikensis]